MHSDAPIIEAILGAHGFVGSWEIARAPGGATGRTYLARLEERRVMVKLGFAHPALQRLSALGVAPPLLAMGSHAGTPFTIHDVIDGDHPSAALIVAHLDQVGALIDTYQRDAPLRRLIGPPAEMSLREHLAREIVDMRRALDGARTSRLSAPEVQAAVAQLARLPVTDQGVGLVPSHTDPNTGNILVEGRRIYLIDWDDLTCSDPVRDVGVLLWWYVPAALWPNALARVVPGTEDLAALMPRVYWWAAVTSLRAALWVDRHAPDARIIAGFIEDGVAAAQGLPNPSLPHVNTRAP